MSVALLLLAALGCTPHTTGSTEVGVRTNKIGLLGGKGVRQEVYPPGSTSFFPPVVTGWNVFDTALQNLEMTREAHRGDRGGDDSLRFKTIDGNDISVNVTVSWRVEPSKAPYLLEFVGANTREVSNTLVRPVARTVLRDVLNGLSSEEYYNAELRFRMAERGRELLNHYLQAEGVAVEQVLLGEHRFNERYEAIILDKKVAEQNAASLRSETEATLEKMKQELEVARGEVQRILETAKGEVEKSRLQADAVYFERERQAQALLAEKSALAEGLTEQAKALAGSGGRNKVKLEVARALEGKTILFLPSGSGMDLRTTDMNALLGAYGASQVQKPTP